MRYPFERHIVICTGSRCNDEKLGKDRGEVIRDEIKDLNKKLGRKKTVRVCSVSCLDLCDDAPNMIIWPGGEVHSRLDRESARRIYLEETEDL